MTVCFEYSRSSVRLTLTASIYKETRQVTGENRWHLNCRRNSIVIRGTMRIQLGERAMNASSVTWQSWSEKWGDWNAWYRRPSIESKTSDNMLAIQALSATPIYVPPGNAKREVYARNGASKNLSPQITY